MTMRNLIRCGAFFGAMALGACKLVVTNPNDPSQVQVKNNPADLDNFLGSLYRRWHGALYGRTSNNWGMASIISFENYSTLANNCQNQRYPVPDAAPNDNSVGNGCAGNQSPVYFIASETARGAADVLRRMDEGLSFGSPAQDARNRAFAEFIRGISLGYLALVYDSSTVITAKDPITPQGTAEPGQLAKYPAVAAEAYLALGNAISSATAAKTATGGGNFPLPGNWMFTSQPANVTADEFIKIVRSYRARIRANMARYPNAAACAAGGPNNVCADEITADNVDWTAVRDDAANGITSDLRITTSTVTGPTMTWTAQWYAYTTWHQMTPFIVGMGDASGSYADWVATPLATRGAGVFFMQTPDQRWPQGSTRAEQRADFTLAGSGTPGNPGCSGPNQVCKRFFRNRDVSDQVSNNWGASQYDHTRYYSWRTSGTGTGQNGPFPFFLKAENDLLQAEAEFRLGNYAAVLPLVNRTRTACGPGNVPAGCTARPAGNGLPGEPGGGLPALTAADNTTPVSGGSTSCVPKRAVNATSAGGGTVTCGTLWDALKWEKRMETAYSHFAPWFLDGRRWGDLAINAPVDWAPPYEDLQTRFRVGLQIYSTGGPVPYHRAAKSGYGW